MSSTPGSSRYVILPPSHLNERVTAFLDSAAWQIAKDINPHANGNDWGTVRSTLDRMYDDLVGTFSERPIEPTGPDNSPIRPIDNWDEV